MKRSVKRRTAAKKFECECCKKKLPVDDFECEDDGWRYKLCSKCRKTIYYGRSRPSSGWYKYHTCLIVRL